MREEATLEGDKESAERMEELPGERAAGGKEERWQLGYELWRGASEKDESSRSRRSLRGSRREARRPAGEVEGKKKKKKTSSATIRDIAGGKKDSPR